MAEMLQINELANHQQNCCTPQLQWLAATQLLEIQCCRSDGNCSAQSGLSDGAIFGKKY